MQLELPYNAHPPFVQGSDTSLLAATQIQSSAKTLRQVVLDYLKRLGYLGATDEEICEALDMAGNTVRPRRRELELSGQVRKTELRRKTRSGRLAVVWRTV